MTYAARYPEQVAGMVLLDSSSPEQLTAIASYAGRERRFGRTSEQVQAQNDAQIVEAQVPQRVQAQDA